MPTDPQQSLDHVPPRLRTAHRNHRLRAAERRIDHWLTTYPALTPEERRDLADRLLAGPRQ